MFYDQDRARQAPIRPCYQQNQTTSWRGCRPNLKGAMGNIESRSSAHHHPFHRRTGVPARQELRNSQGNMGNPLEQLISLKYQPDKTIYDHISAFNKLYLEIKTFDDLKDIPVAIWITRFSRSLPQEYAAFVRSYDKELDKTKLDDVYMCLTLHG